MGIFDFFKIKFGRRRATTDNGVFGPTYLEKYSVHIDNPKDLKTFEWRRLITNNGQKKFRIKFYGQIDAENANRVVDTDFSKPLIYAVDALSNQEILLWDGCLFGYNPMFCDVFTEEQIRGRKVENIYIDKSGEEIFEITVATYYQYNFEKEVGEDIDREGYLTLENGQRIEFDEARRNGFDWIRISLTNQLGEISEIVSEELA